MNLNKAASRYGKALLAFAIERNELARVKADIDTLQNLLNNSREFRAFVDSQVIQEEKKAAIYKRMFSDALSELTLKFFLLVAKNHRSGIIPFICEDFMKEYKIHMKIFTVNVSTASRLDTNIREKLVNILKEQDVIEVHLKETINPDLIGGFIIRTEDRQVDASVSTMLKDLKREIHSTSHLSKI